jgi:hypothetical protein
MAGAKVPEVPAEIEAKMLQVGALNELINGRLAPLAFKKGSTRMTLIMNNTAVLAMELLRQLAEYQAGSGRKSLVSTVDEKLSEDYIESYLRSFPGADDLYNYILGDRGKSSMAAYNALPMDIKVQYADYLKTPVNPPAAAIGVIIPGGPNIAGRAAGGRLICRPTMVRSGAGQRVLYGHQAPIIARDFAHIRRIRMR